MRAISAATARGTPRKPGKALTSIATGPCLLMSKSTPYSRKPKMRPIFSAIDAHSCGTSSATSGTVWDGMLSSTEGRRAAKTSCPMTHILTSEPSPATNSWRMNESSFRLRTIEPSCSTQSTRATKSPRQLYRLLIISGNASSESTPRGPGRSSEETNSRVRGHAIPVSLIRSAINTRSWQVMEENQLLTTSAPRCSSARATSKACTACDLRR